MRNPAYHGKCACDGASNVVTDVIATSATKGLTISVGSRGLATHVAIQRPRPKDKGVAGGGWWSHTRYIYAVYPDNGGFYDNVVNSEKGYAGSDSDHHFVSEGHAADDVQLGVRREICSCDPCIQGDFARCQQKAVVGLQRHVRIKMKSGGGERVATRAAGGGGGTTLDALFTSLSVGDNVVVRVHPSQANACNEEYFLARIQEKPWKLERAGLFSGKRFSRGWLIVRIKWYEIIEVQKNGDRVYRSSRGPMEVINLNGVVKLSRTVTLAPFEEEGAASVLLRVAEHDRIVKYGMLSV
jgi:hypothetical protein